VLKYRSNILEDKRQVNNLFLSNNILNAKIRDDKEINQMVYSDIRTIFEEKGTFANVKLGLLKNSKFNMKSDYLAAINERVACKYFNKDNLVKELKKFNFEGDRLDYYESKREKIKLLNKQADDYSSQERLQHYANKLKYHVCLTQEKLERVADKLNLNYEER
jgi:hypothetical protein